MNLKNITFALALIIPIQLQAQLPDWETVDSLDQFHYFDIACADDTHCMVVGQYMNTVTFIRGTSDGGETWHVLYSDSMNLEQFHLPPHLREIEFPTPDFCIAVGDSGYVVRSTNGGISWTKEQIATPNYILLGLNMYNDSVGCVTSGGTLLLLTENGGLSWQPIDLPPTVQQLGIADVEMPSPRTIVLNMHAYPDNAVVRSDDLGATWQVYPGLDDCPKFYFLDSLYGWAIGFVQDSLPASQAGKDIIRHTIDGGRTWETQLNKWIFPPYGLWDIAFIDRNEGFAVGSFGKTLRTSDGGVTWSESTNYLNSRAFSTVDAVAYPSRDRAYGVTGNGIIIRYRRPVSDVEVPQNSTRSRPHIVLEPNIIPTGTETTVRIACSPATMAVVTLFDLGGQEVIPRLTVPLRSGEQTIRLPVSHLPMGIYYTAVTAAGHTSVSRLLIQ